ncbi:MAG: sarcosine oxidase subunit delta [Paracoccaceae bacterium]
MRITCPHCGERDLREFSYQGAAIALNRPAPDEDAAIWDSYVHLRDNPAGPTRDLWHHTGGCSAWIVVDRNTTNHEISRTRLATTLKRPKK